MSISLSKSLDVFLDASREHFRHAFDPQFVGAFRPRYCAKMPQIPASRVLFTELRYDAGHVVGGGGHDGSSQKGTADKVKLMVMSSSTDASVRYTSVLWSVIFPAAFSARDSAKIIRAAVSADTIRFSPGDTRILML
jgi:hypothetical protein